MNSILHINALTLSTWFNQMGNETKANKYRDIATQFITNIHDVMKIAKNCKNFNNIRTTKYVGIVLLGDVEVQQRCLVRLGFTK